MCVVTAVLRIHRVQHDSPVTSVHLFQMNDYQPLVNHAGILASSDCHCYL